MLHQLPGVCQNKIAKGNLSRERATSASRERERACTHENVLPATIIPFEIQAVLPEVGRDRPVCLQVDIVRVTRAGVPAEA